MCVHFSKSTILSSHSYTQSLSPSLSVRVRLCVFVPLFVVPLFSLGENIYIQEDETQCVSAIADVFVGKQFECTNEHFTHSTTLYLHTNPNLYESDDYYSCFLSLIYFVARVCACVSVLAH